MGGHLGVLGKLGGDLLECWIPGVLEVLGHFQQILSIVLEISAQAMHLAPLGDSIKVGAGCLVIEMH